jgi:asparagine synthase (glutamine-hydrolysing)
MPGLIIIVQNGQDNFESNRAVIKEMVVAAMHENFYRAKFYEFPAYGLHVSKVYLDHEYCPETLSCNNNGTIFCIFSGELFSLQDTKKELRSAGYALDDARDLGELIVHLYELKGESFLRDLNGYFQLVLVDKNKQSIIIANDRFGIHGFYVYQSSNGETSIFAPELKCFKIHPEVHLKLDNEAIIEYFKYNCPLNNLTFYSQVKRVPIASQYIHANNAWSISEYWSPEEVQRREHLSQISFIESATARFESIIVEYINSGRTALSLTGGLDTRAILSVLNKKGIHLPSYTFGGMYRDSLDVKLARKLSDLRGDRHDTIMLGDDFLQNFDKWANKAICVSDGLSRILRCQDYYLNLQARKYGTIRLTGKHGSQIVRGVSLLYEHPLAPDLFSEEFRSEYAACPNPVRTHNTASAIRWELPQLESCAQSQEMAALTVRTPYMDIGIVNLMLMAPTIEDPCILQKTIIERNTPEWSWIPTNRGVVIRKRFYSGIAETIWAKLNFLDQVYNREEKLPAFALNLSRVGDKVGVSRLFNGRDIWRHYRLWFADELKYYIWGVLMDPSTLHRAYWNGRFIEYMLKAHCSRRRAYTLEIDRVLAFELWCRQNGE